MPGLHGGKLTTRGVCTFCDTPTHAMCRNCQRSICRDHRVEGTDLCFECGGPRDSED
ncbi:MAG: hypothetical protein ACT4PT_00270 [Methanobacteriota archaeon]